MCSVSSVSSNTTAFGRKIAGSRSSLACKAVSRRHLLSISWAAPAVLSARDALAAEAEAQGFGDTCPTCLGPVGGTLGSCSGLDTCSSSYDDRPDHFVAPWQFDGSQQAALQHLVEVLQELGASIQQQTDEYVYVTISCNTQGGLVDLEFLFAQNDNTVALRAAPHGESNGSSSSSSSSSSGAGRALQYTLLSLLGSQPSQLLERVRLRLGWEEVPILRNRQRTFFFGESPFDTFGPTPPPGVDYDKDLMDY